MQSQVVCRGCRTRLLFPSGASNVCCALCSTVTTVTPPATNSAAGVELSQLVCGGCRRLLLYDRGAATVQCSCCNTINLARPAQLNCGRCRTTLMYPYGAPSVKCALCQYVTNVGVSNMRVPIPVQRPNGAAHVPPPTSAPKLDAPSQTVVVENPTSVDGSGKLVSNVVVGVSTQKK